MIKKIITQIKSVNLYGVVAVLAVTSLVAFKSETKQADVVWRLNGTTWVTVSGAHSCTASSNICTRTYAAGQNPNSDPSNPIDEEDGNFSQP